MRVIFADVLSVRVINCRSKMELMVVYHLQKVLVSVDLVKFCVARVVNHLHKNSS